MFKAVLFICNKRERSFACIALYAEREIREFQDVLVKGTITLSYGKTMYLSESHSADLMRCNRFSCEMCVIRQSAAVMVADCFVLWLT